MEKRESAFLVLSGKILDFPFSLSALAAIRSAVERELSARGVDVVRRVATLSRNRFLAAPFFLNAGFEIVPADDEDVQASAEIFATLAVASDAPDEVVFALGVSEPNHLLRTLARRGARLTMLTTTDVSGETAANLDELIDVRELFAESGIDWNALDLVAWRDRVGETGAASNAETAENAENVYLLQTSFLQRLAQSENSAKQAFENAEKSPGDEKRAFGAATGPLSPEEAESVYLEPEVGPSPVELDAPEWNAALEKLLLENDLKLPAYRAAERIADRFPYLPTFFLENRDEFRRLLSPQILAVEENSTTSLIHRNSPELRQVSAADAIGSLTLGGSASGGGDDATVGGDSASASNLSFSGGATSGTASASTFGETSRNGEYEREFTVAETFAEVAERAALICEQCKWSVDRYYLQQSGANYKESIEPRDQELARLGREKSTYLWPAHRQLEPEQYLQAAQCYDVTSKAFALLDRVVNTKDGVGDVRFVAKVSQVAADAQCLVKSALRELGLPLSADGVQRDAFNVLTEFRREVAQFTLANMRLLDTLELSRAAEVLAACNALNDEFEDLRSTVKERKSCEGKVEYHLKKLALEPNSLYDWNKVIEAVTTLCETFREPPSSLLFRRLLGDFIDKTPDEAQVTTAFARVVQEIDLARLREEEKFACFPEDSEIEYSPAVKKVREHYGGSSVVFVGGTPQDHLRTRIEEKLNVRLLWSETDHGESLGRYDSALRDENTCLFLIYIPWCSHKHSEEFAASAKSANKDFVRLRKGTNPEQIAQAICRQMNLLPESEF